MRAHRAGDDVFSVPCSRIRSAGRLEFPDERVVAGELFNGTAAQAIGAAVTDVSHKRASRQQRENRARRAHALQLRVTLTLGVDLAVDLFHAVPQCQRWGSLRRFLIDKRHSLRSDRAGHLTGRMCAHAVGHKKEPASGSVLLRAGWRQHRLRILVVRTLATDIGAVAIDEAQAFSHACIASGGFFRNPFSLEHNVCGAYS